MSEMSQVAGRRSQVTGHRSQVAGHRSGLREVTRRHFFNQIGFGIGSLALSSVFNERLFAAPVGSSPQEVAAKVAAGLGTHFAPKAKRVIFLFMAGAPSQLDLFEDKPTLRKFDGQDVPSDIRESIELLDALVMRDGDRIWKIVDRTIALDDFPLSKQIRAVAGIVALELRGVDAKQRQAFVDKHMRDLGTGGTNEDYALRVLKSYAARD